MKLKLKMEMIPTLISGKPLRLGGNDDGGDDYDNGDANDNDDDGYGYDDDNDDNNDIRKTPMHGCLGLGGMMMLVMITIMMITTKTIMVLMM